MSNWIEDLPKKHGAIITDGHFVLTSGRHSSTYINLRDLVKKCPSCLALIASEMRNAIYEHERSAPARGRRSVIIGPETLGRTLTEILFMGSRFDNFAWATKHPDASKDEFCLDPKFGFEEILRDADVYIVDDVLTTGKSIIETKKIVELCGGDVRGAIVAVRRAPTATAESMEIPWLHFLVDIAGSESYEGGLCPMCEKQVPMRLTPGHGYKWTAEFPDYPTC